MESIVSDIIKIIKSSPNQSETEKQLLNYFAILLAQLMQLALEAIDDELHKEFKAKGYIVEKKDVRTIQFLFGAVTFKRRRMKVKGEKGCYPLDLSCGFEKRARYSLLVQRRIAELSTKMVYRGVETAVGLLTSFSVSHAEVGRIIRKVGTKQSEWTRKKLEENLVALPENREVPFLIIEGDGVQIKGIKKRKKEIHRVQLCEGVIKNGNRTQLVKPQYFSSLESSKKAWEKLEKYLSAKYRLDNTIVISNTDGGSGYSFDNCSLAIGVCKQHIHFIDRYHVNKKIKSRFSFCKKLEKPMKQALWDYDWNNVEVVLQTAESMAEGVQAEEQLENVEKLRNYLKRNWPYLKKLKDYGLDQEVRGIGSCESNHRPYSYRMKGNGKYWGEQGAEAMVSIIEGLKNGTLDRALSEEIPEYEQMYSPELNRSVRESLRKIKPAASVGARQGTIRHTKSSSLEGKLHKTFCMS